MSAKQVDSSHYWNESYICRERFLHYREQFVAMMRLKPSSVLEIGPGPGLLSSMLKCICGKVVTLDFAEDLNPDIVADIKSIPLENASFDVVCSFQVLEHIPWNEVSDAVREMARVAKKYVLFSVPDNNMMRTPIVSIRFTLLEHSTGYTLTRKSHNGVSNPKEHHWEIGINGVSAEDLEEIISKAGMSLINCWLDGVDRYFLCNASGGVENSPGNPL